MFRHVNAPVGIRHVEKLSSLFRGGGGHGILDKKAGKTLVTWVNATPTEHSANLEMITFQKNQTGWLLAQ